MKLEIFKFTLESWKVDADLKPHSKRIVVVIHNNFEKAWDCLKTRHGKDGKLKFLSREPLHEGMVIG